MPLVIAFVLLAVYAFFRSNRGGGASSAGGVGGPSGSSIPGPNTGDVLDNISQQIAVVEGFFLPGSRANRLNNPGNVGGDSSGGFADAGDGWDALSGWITKTAAANPTWDYYDLMHYYQTGDTLGQSKPGFISADTYAEQVAAAAGVDPTQTVSSSLWGY